MPFFNLEYGWMNQMCWVTSEDLTQTYNLIIFMLFFYAPVFGLGVFLIICYIKIYQKLKEIPEDFLKMADLKAAKFFWYPAGFFIAFLPSQIDTLVFLITGKRHPAMLYIHLAVSHSLGLINSLIYATVRISRKRIQEEQEEQIR